MGCLNQQADTDIYLNVYPRYSGMKTSVTKLIDLNEGAHPER